MKEATEKYDVTLRDLFPNQKAYVAALQLLGENVDATIDIFGNMAKVVGDDVEDSFQKGAHTMERTYNQAMGALSSTAIDLGNNLAPLIDKFGELAKGASSTAKAFNELDDYHKSLITSAATFAISLGPILYIMGSLSRVTARFIGLSILLNLSWVKGAAAAMTQTKAVTALSSQMKILNLTKTQLVGSMATALVVGYQFGKWLDHTLGITDYLEKAFARFGSSVDTVGDVLEGDTDRMILMSSAAHNLALKIGETALAEDIAAAAHAGNGREVALLTERINEKAQAYNKARIKVEGLTQEEEQFAKGQQAIKDAQAEIDLEESERLKKLREAHGLMTSDEVTDKMNELTNQYKDHIDAGVSRNLVNEKMVGDTEDLVELMREYGIAATDSFKKMAASMNETGDIENNEFYKMFAYYIPNAINAIPGKVIEGMVEINSAVADGLKGGLNRGFADGMTEFHTTFKPALEGALNATWKGGFTGFGNQLRDEINTLVAEISPIEIDVIPNKQVFADAMLDVMDGNPPDTRG
jgi:hypothetical protein